MWLPLFRAILRSFTVPLHGIRQILWNRINIGILEAEVGLRLRITISALALSSAIIISEPAAPGVEAKVRTGTASKHRMFAVNNETEQRGFSISPHKINGRMRWSSVTCITIQPTWQGGVGNDETIQLCKDVTTTPSNEDNKELQSSPAGASLSVSLSPIGVGGGSVSRCFSLLFLFYTAV